MNLDSKERLRTALVKWVYDETGGSERALAQMATFTVPGGWTGEKPADDDVADAIKWLEGQGLILAHWTMGGLPSVQLTHWGIQEIEQAMREPERRTENLGPLINILHVQGSIYGSQLQQGSAAATQTGTFAVDLAVNSEAFIAEARKLLDKVDGATRAQAEADLATMERERAHGRWEILKAVGSEVRSYLVAAVGPVAAAALESIPWP